jgi:hypothetical protein
MVETATPAQLATLNTLDGYSGESLASVVRRIRQLIDKAESCRVSPRFALQKISDELGLTEQTVEIRELAERWGIGAWDVIDSIAQHCRDRFFADYLRPETARELRLRAERFHGFDPLDVQVTLSLAEVAELDAVHEYEETAA